MDVVIKRNGTNISNYVLNYTRDHDLCSGIGTLQIIVDPTSPTIQPGNTITIFEDGNLVGTFYTHTLAESPNKGIVVNCQDDSQFMQTYFEPTLNKTNSASSRYWISWILDRAKVSYNFTTASSGYTLPPDDQLGFETAYDVVLRMCQQSGWYFYFNASGVCQIGSLSQSWHNPDGTIAESGNKILKEQLVSNDEKLRNKVIVWGGSTTQGEESSRVYTELNTTTPWDRDAKDRRAIVFANHFIHDHGTAWSLGKKLLDEHSKTLSIKLYQIAGYVNLTVGDVVKCKTRIFNGVGRVTGVQATVGQGGFVTTIIIDDRCPRIFGYWNSTDEFVYAGTNGDGVWRKTFSGSTWTNFSTGLTNLVIKDLKIKSGLFVCTTNDYRAYTREVGDSSWSVLSPSNFIDEEDTEYDITTLITAGCGINELTGEIYIGYNSTTNNRSWVVTVSTLGTFTTTLVSIKQDILTPISYDNTIIDTDTNSSSIILSIEKVGGSSFEADTFMRSGGREGANLSTATGTDESDNPHQYSLVDVTIQPDEAVHVGPPFSISQIENSCWDGNYIYYRSDSDDKVYWWKPSDGSSGSKQIIAGVYPLWITVMDDQKIMVGLANAGTAVTYLYDRDADTVTLKNSTAGWTMLGQATAYTKDSDNTAYSVCMMRQVTADGWTKFRVEFTNEAGSTVVKENTYSVDANSYIDWVGDNNSLRNTNDFAMNILSVDTTPVGPGAHYFYTFIQRINLQTQDVTWFSLDHVDSVGSDMTSFASVYDTFSNAAYFDLFDYNALPAAGNYHKVKVPEIGSVSTQDIGPLGGGVVSINRGIMGTERGYFIDNNSVIKYANSYSTKLTAPGRDVVGYIDDVTGHFYYINATLKKLIAIGPGGLPKFNLPSLQASPFGFDGFFCGKNLVIYNETEDELYFYSPKSSDPGAGAGYGAAKNLVTVSGGGQTFLNTRTFSNPLQLEISRDSPVVFFGGFQDISPPHGLMECFVTPTAASGTFVSMLSLIEGRIPFQNAGYVPDLRVGDVLGMGNSQGGITIESPPLDYARYLFATQLEGETPGYGEVIFTDAYSTLDNAWKWFDTFSGAAWRIETTNYTSDTPYIFVSTSGTPSKFWQLDPGLDTFDERSTDLPNSNITVIRADDRI